MNVTIFVNARPGFRRRPDGGGGSLVAMASCITSTLLSRERMATFLVQPKAAGAVRSTREPPPAFAFGYGLNEHGLIEHGLNEHGLNEHGLNEHGLNGYGLNEHGLIEHGLIEQGLIEHGLNEHGLNGYGLNEFGRSSKTARSLSYSESVIIDSGWTHSQERLHVGQPKPAGSAAGAAPRRVVDGR